MSTQVNFHVRMFPLGMKLSEDLEQRLKEKLRQAVLDTLFDYDPALTCEVIVRGPEVVRLF